MKFCLLFCFVFMVLTLGLSAKTIDYCGRFDFDLTVTDFTPPLVIEDGQLRTGEKPPVWWPAYDAQVNFRDGRSYEEWSRYFTPRVLRILKASPEQFAARKAQVPNTVLNPPIRTVLYQVEVVWGKRHILLIPSVDALIERVPSDLNELGTPVRLLIYERAPDGTWQNQTARAIGFVREVPFANPAKLAAIMKAGAVYYHHGMHPVVASGDSQSNTQTTPSSSLDASAGQSQ